MANLKLKSSLYGRWEMVSNQKGQAYIEFRADGCGSFDFGNVQGQFEYRTLFRHLQEIGIEVAVQDDLPKITEEVKEYLRLMKSES